jgi:hypothetical protein
VLGRKDYKPEEVENGQKAVRQQLAAYKQLVKAVDGDAQAAKALEAFESILFTNMILVLDRYYVHRLRSSTGKDGNPLNEVELLADSLMNNGGKFRGNNVIKYKPDEAVLKIEEGEPIRLTAGQFERLSKAFFEDLESKFVR